MISKDIAEKIRADIQAYEAARKGFDPRRYEKGGGYTPAEIATIEKMAGLTHSTVDTRNAQRGDLEQYDFFHDAPERYFLYIDDATGRATTWNGLLLGRVEHGSSYKSPSFGHPSVRVPVKVYAINGWIYSGTYYASSGNYARVKRTTKKHRDTFPRPNPAVECSASPKRDRYRAAKVMHKGEWVQNGGCWDAKGVPSYVGKGESGKRRVIAKKAVRQKASRTPKFVKGARARKVR